MNKLVRKVLELGGQPRVRLLGGILLLIGLVVVIGGWQSGLGMEDLKVGLDRLLKFLQDRPFILFFGIAILTACPIPASALLILAGIVYTPLVGPFWACIIAMVAMGISMSWSYWLAATIGHRWVEWLLKKLEMRVPALDRGHMVQLILVLRLTPGFPFFVQNLVLGFLRAPFWLYLPLSLGLTTIFIVGFVVSGGAIFEGKAGVALLGVALIVIAIAGTSLLRAKLAKKGAAKKSSLTEEA